MSVITLFFTLNPAMADSFVVDGITYRTMNYNDYVEIIRVPNQEDITIPDNVFCEAKKYIVYSVESNAFDNCTKLVSLTLPPTLRYFFAHLDNCTNLVRININSMYDFMELNGDFFTNSDVGLYLNGKLVERVDIINEEPKQSLRGYQKLRSVTFCNPHMTELNSGMLMDCSNIDTLCFKSPIMRSSNSLGSKTISELCWILYLLLITLIIITLVNPFEYHFTVVSVRSELLGKQVAQFEVIDG